MLRETLKEFADQSIELEGDLEEIDKGNEDFFDMFGGYQVTKVSEDGQFDGEPAVVITLADSLGHRNVGVVRIRKDAYRDAYPIWTRVFTDEADLVDFREHLNAPKKVGDVVTFAVKMFFEPFEDVNKQLAMWADAYRCNFTLLSGPRDGDAIVQVHGLTSRARVWLTECYDEPDEPKQDDILLG